MREVVATSKIKRDSRLLFCSDNEVQRRHFWGICKTGSPNYVPRAKSGSRSRFILPARAGWRGGNWGSCPGAPLQGGPSWWYLFVSNKTLVWKFSWFMSDKGIQTYFIFLCCVKYQRAPNSNWFLYNFDCLPVLVISTEKTINIFGFVQCKYISFRW